MVIQESSGMEVDPEDKDTIVNSDRMKDSILDSVSKSKGFFKSQQVGEKDLTLDEKRVIASDLLGHNVPLFLQRYWQYIKLEDIDFFGSSDNYEINFYLSEIRKFRDSRKNRTRIKNRRLGALRKMVKDGTYFSDDEMKKRNPFMFHQMIFQHLTENERIEAYKLQNKDEGFSGFLMGQLERNVENCLFNEQKDEDEAVEEENDTESDDNSEEESELEDDPPKPLHVDAEEKARLRSEFTNIMYENFLSGKDKDFDYDSVDFNAEYDPVEGDLDAEEKYFDEDASN